MQIACLMFRPSSDGSLEWYFTDVGFKNNQPVRKKHAWFGPENKPSSNEGTPLLFECSEDFYGAKLVLSEDFECWIIYRLAKRHASPTLRGGLEWRRFKVEVSGAAPRKWKS